MNDHRALMRRLRIARRRKAHLEQQLLWRLTEIDTALTDRHTGPGAAMFAARAAQYRRTFGQLRSAERVERRIVRQLSRLRQL